MGIGNKNLNQQLGPHRTFISKVAAARQLLKEKSEDILKQYLLVVDEARAAGDYETSMKGLQWLIDHMPSDEQGERLVEVSVDKKVQAPVDQKAGPSISIGIAVGGLGPQRSLEGVEKPRELQAGDVIDVEVKE